LHLQGCEGSNNWNPLLTSFELLLACEKSIRYQCMWLVQSALPGITEDVR
jgi:hypothetical protein